jgi:hypothetical protein
MQKCLVFGWVNHILTAQLSVLGSRASTHITVSPPNHCGVLHLDLGAMSHRCHHTASCGLIVSCFKQLVWPHQPAVYDNRQRATRHVGEAGAVCLLSANGLSTHQSCPASFSGVQRGGFPVKGREPLFCLGLGRGCITLSASEC